MIAIDDKKKCPPFFGFSSLNKKEKTIEKMV